MKRNVCVLLSLAAVFLLVNLAAAQEKATKEECVAKSKEAAQMVLDKGVEEAFKAINDKSGPFVWKDSYVFCIDMEKKANVAHPINPNLIGKNMMAAKDKNGKMFFAEFINVATAQGEGWVSYMWPKPDEKTPSPKITYVYRVPGHNLLMAAGIYE
ncbi:MAG: cache domain-containing protein [Pseudomonadota bacterium]